MRILAVPPGPSFSTFDVYRGWCDAFEQLGCQVVRFPLTSRIEFYEAAGKTAIEALWMASKGLEAACYEVWPDIVFIVAGNLIPPPFYQLARERGHTVVLYLTESPYEDGREAPMAAWADVVLVNDYANLDVFRAHNPNSHYQPHSYDPALHRPGAHDRHDLVWCGTGFPSRIEFFEAADLSGLDVAFAGNWQATDPDSPIRRWLIHDLDGCYSNADTANLYRSGKASVNIYRTETDGTSVAGAALGPREVELAACRTFFLRQPRDESDRLFPMLPCFDGPDDMADRLRWWLEHPTERAAAAAQAAAAIADRTFVNHAKQLLARTVRARTAA